MHHTKQIVSRILCCERHCLPADVHCWSGRAVELICRCVATYNGPVAGQVRTARPHRLMQIWIKHGIKTRTGHKSHHSELLGHVRAVAFHSICAVGFFGPSIWHDRERFYLYRKWWKNTDNGVCECLHTVRAADSGGSWAGAVRRGNCSPHKRLMHSNSHIACHILSASRKINGESASNVILFGQILGYSIDALPQCAIDGNAYDPYLGAVYV